MTKNSGDWEGFHVDNEPGDASRQWTAILYLSGDGSLGAHAEGAAIFPDGWCRTLVEACSVRKYLGLPVRIYTEKTTVNKDSEMDPSKRIPR
eukprot:s2784_g11.t1